jgi:hypothetical protein
LAFQIYQDENPPGLLNVDLLDVALVLSLELSAAGCHGVGKAGECSVQLAWVSMA